MRLVAPDDTPDPPSGPRRQNRMRVSPQQPDWATIREINLRLRDLTEKRMKAVEKMDEWRTERARLIERRRQIELARAA